MKTESIAQDDLLQLLSWPSSDVLEPWIKNATKSGTDSCIGMNFLHIFSEVGIRSCVIAILSSPKRSILFNSMDGRRRTPLSYGAEQGHDRIVELLLEREDNEINSKDIRGQTTLSYAIMSRNETTVKLLRQKLSERGKPRTMKERTSDDKLTGYALTEYDLRLLEGI